MKGPCGYEVNIAVRETTSFRLISTRRGVSRKRRYCSIKPPFQLHAGALVREQGCNFCGWQRYERGELVDVCGGNWNGLPRQMMMSCRKSRAGVDSRQGGALRWMKYDGDGGQPPVSFPVKDVAGLLFLLAG